MLILSHFCSSRSPGKKPDVKLTLSEAIMCLQEKDEEDIPKEHTLIVSTVSSQTLGVLAQKNGKLYREPFYFILCNYLMPRLCHVMGQQSPHHTHTPKNIHQHLIS